ncbi:glycoside hydrolase superfamily [Mrakia frigida]|uniref:glycoside hydrolase family 5 protein n=1 Tax=Mrakia frigida TaxID=29902 RepID=UPI003FCBFD78
MAASSVRPLLIFLLALLALSHLFVEICSLNVMSFLLSLLHRGNQIVNERGEEVILKGAGLGGWLNMENFITGYPGHEDGMRRSLKGVMGQEKYDRYFNGFLEHFFTEKDAEFFASLGLNCIRVPFNYRHFESDGVWLEAGFQWLERVVNLCSARGIFVIPDLHAAPGGQNIDWHADTGVHRALFFEYRDFQTRAINLWKEIARRYKGNTWIAGWNILNEPTDPEHTRIVAWYDRAEKEIRAIDPEHILFIDGNTWAADFSYFKEPLPNSAYAYHDYTNFGFPAGGGYQATEDQKAKLKRSFERKVEFMKSHNGPMWNGEFGPVYESALDGPGWEKKNEERYTVLRDQLDIYTEARSSWTIWLYKDIGFQGMVYADPEGPYIKLLAPFLAKKKRLAADEWGTDLSTVQHIFQPLEDWLEKEVPSIKQRYPPMWNTSTHVGRLVRNILLSEELYPQFAEYFKDLSFDQIDALAASFALENCKQREGLNEILRSRA